MFFLILTSEKPRETKSAADDDEADKGDAFIV